MGPERREHPDLEAEVSVERTGISPRSRTRPRGDAVIPIEVNGLITICFAEGAQRREVMRSGHGAPSSARACPDRRVVGKPFASGRSSSFRDARRGAEDLQLWKRRNQWGLLVLAVSAHSLRSVPKRGDGATKKRPQSLATLLPAPYKADRSRWWNSCDGEEICQALPR